MLLLTSYQLQHSHRSYYLIDMTRLCVNTCRYGDWLLLRLRLFDWFVVIYKQNSYIIYLLLVSYSSPPVGQVWICRHRGGMPHNTLACKCKQASFCTSNSWPCVYTLWTAGMCLVFAILATSTDVQISSINVTYGMLGGVFPCEHCQRHALALFCAIDIR